MFKKLVIELKRIIQFFYLKEKRSERKELFSFLGFVAKMILLLVFLVVTMQALILMTSVTINVSAVPSNLIAPQVATTTTTTTSTEKKWEVSPLEEKKELPTELTEEKIKLNGEKGELIKKINNSSIQFYHPESMKKIPYVVLKALLILSENTDKVIGVSDILGGRLEGRVDKKRKEKSLHNSTDPTKGASDGDLEGSILDLQNLVWNNRKKLEEEGIRVIELFGPDKEKFIPAYSEFSSEVARAIWKQHSKTHAHMGFEYVGIVKAGE
ncbi:MAG: hypothetical protein V1910_03150 [bacterium]